MRRKCQLDYMPKNTSGGLLLKLQIIEEESVFKSSKLVNVFFRGIISTKIKLLQV